MKNHFEWPIPHKWECCSNANRAFDYHILVDIGNSKKLLNANNKKGKNTFKLNNEGFLFTQFLH